MCVNPTRDATISRQKCRDQLASAHSRQWHPWREGACPVPQPCPSGRTSPWDCPGDPRRVNARGPERTCGSTMGQHPPREPARDPGARSPPQIRGGPRGGTHVLHTHTNVNIKQDCTRKDSTVAGCKQHRRCHEMPLNWFRSYKYKLYIGHI